MRRVMNAQCLAAAAALVLAFQTNAALAQDGFGINRFEPAERGSEWFTGDSLDFRGHLRPAAGLTLDWGHKPLVVEDQAGNETALVENQLFAHLGGSLVLWERLRVGASLPIALYQSGESAVMNGQTFTPPGEAAVGDLRLSADVRLLGAYRDVFSLAAGVRAWLPTGNRAQYTGDDAVRLGGHVMAAGEISRFVYSARLGVVYRNLEEGFGTTVLGTDMPFAVTAGVRLLDGALVVGPELSGSTVLVDGGAFHSTTTPVELLFGGHYTAGDFRFGAGIGPGLSNGVGASQVRSLLSFEYIPHIEVDSDNDGVPDDKDRCPHERGTDSGDPARLGCPADGDGDGVNDTEDACPGVAGVASAESGKNGCPADDDGDGIPNDVDACPQSAANTADGCPVRPGDEDNDGVPDASDACPGVAGEKSDDPKANGCPATKDDDGDGVPNDVDACPTQAGSASTDAAQNGCPRAVVSGDQVSISESIKFATGSAELLPESDAVLADVARAMKTLPEGTVVRIEGHTDNIGRQSTNLALSKQRAETVLRWLVDRGGVPAERLQSVGVGDERPLVPNTTDENRTKNRRVEFHVEKK